MGKRLGERWKEDIERYKNEQSLRREQDLASLESQMAELERKRLEENENVGSK